MREAMAVCMNCLEISLPICLLRCLLLAPFAKQWLVSCIVCFFLSILFSGLLQPRPLCQQPTLPAGFDKCALCIQRVCQLAIGCGNETYERWCLHSWRVIRLLPSRRVILPVARQSACLCQRLPVRSCQHGIHRHLWC
jgi:hypothetical protein